MPYVKVSVVMRTFILTGREKKEGGRRDNKVWKKSSSVFEGIIYLNLQIKPRKHTQALKQALHYFEEHGKPNSRLSTVISIVLFFSAIKFIVAQKLFGYPHSLKYIILCSAQERNHYMFGTSL